MEIKEEYEGRIFTVEFVSGWVFKKSHVGKHWPIATQCIVKRDGLIIGLGEVVKHEKDKDDPQYAKNFAAKKAFENAKYKIWRDVRTRLWTKILGK